MQKQCQKTNNHKKIIFHNSKGNRSFVLEPHAAIKRAKVRNKPLICKKRVYKNVKPLHRAGMQWLHIYAHSCTLFAVLLFNALELVIQRAAGDTQFLRHESLVVVVFYDQLVYALDLVRIEFAVYAVDGIVCGERTAVWEVGCAAYDNVIRLYDRPGAYVDGAFYYIAQLSYIPRPIIGHQLVERLLGDTCDGVAELTEKMLRQQGNVLLAPAQRQQRQLKHVYAVIQIGAEGVVAYAVEQVAVAGGDYAYIDLLGF